MRNRDFANWIKGRIKEFGFLDGEGYLLTKTRELVSSGTKYKIE